MPFRWFGRLLPLALAGYLFFDRSFAYLHVPGTPLFIGEIVLAVGCIEAVRGRRLLMAQVRQSLVLRMIALFVFIGAVRLLFADLAVYRIDAVRDSALWYYALFTFLVITLLQARPGWLDDVRLAYERALPVFLLWAPVAVVLERVQPLRVTVPDSIISVTSFRPGNIGVHVALALAYLWLVTPRSSFLQQYRGALTALGLAGVLVVGTQNRAGLLAATLGLGVAWLLSPLRTRFTVTAGAALLLLVTLPTLLGVSVKVSGRDLSVAQIAQNASSIVMGSRAEGSLGDNVEWRQRLWSLAVDDLFDSGRAPLGFGYGPNIAARYSFSNPDQETALRNPHNSHLSILVRMGIIGAMAWLLLWIAWVIPVTCALLRSSLARGPTPLRLWAWSATGILSILLNAFFDPTLEGPQVGIWLWTLVAVGVHQRRRCDEATRRRTGPPAVVRARRPSATHLQGRAVTPG